MAEGVYQINRKVRTNFLQGVIERETCYRAAFGKLLVSSIISYLTFTSCVHTTADETA